MAWSGSQTRPWAAAPVRQIRHPGNPARAARAARRSKRSCTFPLRRCPGTRTWVTEFPLRCLGACCATPGSCRCSKMGRVASLMWGARRGPSPPALRRALRARDRGCRFPGCTHTRFVDGHHVRHWLHGGETSLENTLLLCRRHHRAVHEHGFTVDREDGDLVFRDPAGAILPPGGPRRSPRANPFDLLRRRVDPAGALTPATNAPGWDGWPVDYDACVSACLTPS